jgi:N-acetylmuramoyl-L-alanine amidase
LSPLRALALAAALLAPARAQVGSPGRPLAANGARLTAVFPVEPNLAYARAADLAGALGLRLAEAPGYATLSQGGRVLSFRVADEPGAARFTPRAVQVNGRTVSGPAAVWSGGRLLLPVRAVAEGVGASFSDDGRRVRVYLEPARLLPPVRSDRSAAAERAVLELSRDANVSDRREGDLAVIEVENATGDEAVYETAEEFRYLKRIEIRAGKGKLVARIPLPDGSGYRVFASPAATRTPARLVVDVGPAYRREPPALEARKPTVVLDPGHGGADPGVKGGGLVEKDLALSVARRVGAVLASRGVAVRYTRTGDSNPSLAARRERSLESDAFVSLHASNLPGSSAAGLGVYASSGTAGAPATVSAGRAALPGADERRAKLLGAFLAPADASLRLADAISGRVIGQPGGKARVFTVASAPVLSEAPKAAVLVELGYLSSPEDVARLRDPARRDRLAEAIAGGLLEHLAPLLPAPKGTASGAATGTATGAPARPRGRP